MKRTYYVGILISILTFSATHLTYAQNNTSYGDGAGTGGSYNAFFGAYSGKDNTGSTNTFIGAYSGYKITTGSNNTFLGYKSGFSSTGGAGNISLGDFSGYSNTSGNSNIFIGSYSGFSNTTGGTNIFIGPKAGYGNTSGVNNIFLGVYSGTSNTEGSYNTIVGYYAGYNLTTGIGNVFLGDRAGYNETGSNRLYIENSDSNVPLIYGKFDTDQLGINTNNVPAGYTLAIDGRAVMEEVKVQASADWPDYVFAPDYNLRSLEETEGYIRENWHLPDIPSAEEVDKDGIQLGEMNRLLLEKIEELTLYLIEQQKQIKDQQKQLDALEELIKVTQEDQ